MGIININDDSFSGDGTLDVSEAQRLADRMISEGADWIDVGAESARTNRGAIPVEQEIERLMPFIEKYRGTARLSINTWRPEVIEAILGVPNHGIDLINDMSGLPEGTNARICAENGEISLLLMHTVGAPKIPHLEAKWDDVVSSIRRFFEEKIELAEQEGLNRDRIVLDPGIDFAKQCGDNLAIFARLEELINQFEEFPFLLPISRKTVIGDVLGIENPVERDAGTIACLARGIGAGAHLFRVHNVKAVADSLRVLDALR
ncbi:MAG: dihydropteroate synthase [Verrucomicrobiales bacterium]|nr:dihydropteroate synthase [Verrucomicrobiales bacterium]